MELFKTVYFEVRSKCNGGCAFCMGNPRFDDREDILMPFDLYTHVVQQLVLLGFTGTISYHVTNDPLLRPDLETFIAYAVKEIPEARPSVLTNGKLLTLERAESLINAGLRQLEVNHYTANPTKVPDKFVEIGKLCTNRGVTYTCLVRHVNEVLDSRGGTSPNKSYKLGHYGDCTYPSIQFNINPKGLVSKCCADVRFIDPMGDVTKESILEIWEGERFNRVREKLRLNCREELECCKECDFPGNTRFAIADFATNELTHIPRERLQTAKLDKTYHKS